MRFAVALVLLTACSAGGGASVACEEFVTRDVGDVDFTDTEVEERGETESGGTVYRVTGTVVAEFSEHAYECQVRNEDGEWVLERLQIDD